MWKGSGALTSCKASRLSKKSSKNNQFYASRGTQTALILHLMSLAQEPPAQARHLSAGWKRGQTRPGDWLGGELQRLVEAERFMVANEPRGAACVGEASGEPAKGSGRRGFRVCEDFARLRVK